MSLVVGSVAYDSVTTPFGHRRDALGGSATYFSITASNFIDPSLVAAVGEDFRQEDVDLIRNHGVDVSGLKTSPDGTFRWGARYHDDMNGRDTLFTELNALGTFQPELTAEQKRSSMVFLANIQPDLQLNVLDQVDSPRFVAADTMNLWINETPEDLKKVLSRVDALFINDEEANLLAQRRTVFLAGRAIQEMGPELVVIKRGEHGALMLNGDDTFYVPAYPLEQVIDPTGAGDTWAGGFLGHLAKTDDFSQGNVRRAAVVGSLMASFCVEGFSVERLSTVDMEQVRHRYQAFQDLVHFEPFNL